MISRTLWSILSYYFSASNINLRRNDNLRNWLDEVSNSFQGHCSKISYLNPITYVEGPNVITDPKCFPAPISHTLLINFTLNPLVCRFCCHNSTNKRRYSPWHKQDLRSESQAEAHCLLNIRDL